MFVIMYDGDDQHKNIIEFFWVLIENYYDSDEIKLEKGAIEVFIMKLGLLTLLNGDDDYYNEHNYDDIVMSLIIPSVPKQFHKSIIADYVIFKTGNEKIGEYIRTLDEPRYWNWC